MPFVNERISPEDAQRYQIAAIDRRYLGGTLSRRWTIDRQRDVYLRCVKRGGPESTNSAIWTLYWKGGLIRFDTELLKTSPLVGGHISTHERVTRIDLPPELEAERRAILDAFRDALTEYKDAGVDSQATTYSLTLDF